MNLASKEILSSTLTSPETNLLPQTKKKDKFILFFKLKFLEQLLIFFEPGAQSPFSNNLEALCYLLYYVVHSPNTAQDFEKCLKEIRTFFDMEFFQEKIKGFVPPYKVVYFTSQGIIQQITTHSFLKSIQVIDEIPLKNVKDPEKIWQNTVFPRVECTLQQSTKHDNYWYKSQLLLSIETSLLRYFHNGIVLIYQNKQTQDIKKFNSEQAMVCLYLFEQPNKPITSIKDEMKLCASIERLAELSQSSDKREILRKNSRATFLDSIVLQSLMCFDMEITLSIDTIQKIHTKILFGEVNKVEKLHKIIQESHQVFQSKKIVRMFHHTWQVEAKSTGEEENRLLKNYEAILFIYQLNGACLHPLESTQIGIPSQLCKETNRKLKRDLFLQRRDAIPYCNVIYYNTQKEPFQLKKSIAIEAIKALSENILKKSLSSSKIEQEMCFYINKNNFQKKISFIEEDENIAKYYYTHQAFQSLCTTRDIKSNASQSYILITRKNIEFLKEKIEQNEWLRQDTNAFCHMLDTIMLQFSSLMSFFNHISLTTQRIGTQKGIVAIHEAYCTFDVEVNSEKLGKLFFLPQSFFQTHNIDTQYREEEQKKQYVIRYENILSDTETEIIPFSELKSKIESIHPFFESFSSSLLKRSSFK